MRGDFFSTVGEILKYGGSTFIALAIVSIYMTTDSFFIGNWIGSEGLQAMALVYPVTIIFMSLGIIFETGASAVVSEKIGAGQKNLAEKIIRTNYVFGIFIGVIVFIAGNILVEPVLYWLGDNSGEIKIIELAISYLKINFFGVPFLLTIYLTSTFMRCIEQPTHVFYFMGLTSLTNIILDALFIAVFGWGMNGGALATVLSQILGAVLSIWYFKYSKQKLKTSPSFSGVEYIFTEFKIGAGFGIANLLLCIVEYLLNATLLQYNAPHLLAVSAVATVVLSFVYMPLSGLDTGTQPLISKFFAAKQETKLLRILNCEFYLTLFISCITFLFVMIFAEEIVRFFIASGEPVTDDMILFLRLVFLLQPIVGIFTWLSGMLAALEDEWRNIVICSVPIFVNIPAILLLPKILPIEYVALNFTLQDFFEMTLAFLFTVPFLKTKGLSLKKIFRAY